MGPLRVHLAPGLASLAALGVPDASALFDAQRPVPRAELLLADGCYECLRLPLPGTPSTLGGPLTEPPAGAGTGWIRLERWRAASLRSRLSVRCSRPRSRSAAERRWNLHCHLRAHGVGTPEPLAVGARGEGLVARDSFLVTRELDPGCTRLDAWLAGAPAEDVIAFTADALGAALRALAASRAQLPRLDAQGVWLRFGSLAGKDVEAGDGSGCGLNQLASWRAERALHGLARDPRPAVLVTALEGGRIAARPEPVARIAARLGGSLERSAWRESLLASAYGA